MRQSFIMLIYLILLLTLSISTVDSIWIPSTPKPAPAMPVDNQFTSTPSQGRELVIKLESTSRSTDAASLPIGYNPIDDNNEQMQIKKLIKPNNNDYYLPNKVYSVYVDLKGIGRDLNDIFIEEIVDSNIQIINLSEPRPAEYDPFYEKDASSIDKGNCTFDKKSNKIFLRINRLEPKHHINYTYNIKTSNKLGIFDLLTSVRIAGNLSKINDLDFVKEIQIKPPEFEVNVDVEKLSADIETPLKVTYYMRYKSPCSQEPYPCNITLENTDQYKIYLNDSSYKSKSAYRGDQIPERFWFNNYTLRNIIIVYNQSGPHRLPSIMIEGYHFPFEAQISVNNPVYKFFEDRYSAASILGLILTLVFTIYQLNLLRKEIEHLEKSATQAQLIPVIPRIHIMMPIAALLLALIAGIYCIYYHVTTGIISPVFDLILIIVMLIFYVIIILALNFKERI